MRWMLLGLVLTWPQAALGLGVSSVKLSRDGVLLTEADKTRLVNVARCECDEGIDVAVGFTGRTGTGEVVIAAGTRCVDSDGRIESSCDVLWRSQIADIAAVEEISFSTQRLAGGSCAARTGTDNLEILVDENDDDTWAALTTVAYGVDTAAPKAPEKKEVVAGEGLAEVAFAAHSDAETTTSYQVLCARGADPLDDTPPDAGFESTADRCDGDGPRAAYVCSEVQNNTASVTIAGLENGVEYTFDVVAIDAAGNPSESARIGTATPAPEEDLWERYKRSGGAADGEACFVATAAYGDYSHPSVRWLRVFRDVVMLRTTEGRALVDLYYSNSPPAARRIDENAVLRVAASGAIQRLTWFAIAVLVQGEKT